MKKIYLQKFWLIVFIIGLQLHRAEAQTQYIIKKADRFYNELQYASAAPLYEQAVKEASTPELLTRTAECFRMLNDSKNAEKYYEKAVSDGNAKPEIMLHYAQALVQNKKYEEAKPVFERYQKMVETDRRAGHYIASINKLSALYADSADFKINLLSINSKGNDFAPAFYKGGIAFCSDRAEWQAVKNVFTWHQSNFLNIYYADNSSIEPTVQIGDQSLPKISGDVNSKYHEGPLVMESQNNAMIFTRNNYYQNKYKTDKQGVNKLKLFTAKVEGEAWKDIKELPFNSDEYSVGHPALSPNGQTLYFISDMPGSAGHTDIWKVERLENGWGDPQNLGPVVNTEGREMFPFVDKQGNLFFASDGWGGLGGLDIFYARFNGKEFEKPVNLGYPINTNKDDFSLIVKDDNRSGYFSSHRNGDTTGDDIYAFESTKPLIKTQSAQLEVADKESLKLLYGSEVTIADEAGNPILKTVFDSLSVITFPIERNRHYIINAKKNGYLPETMEWHVLDVEPGPPLAAKVLMKPEPLYTLLGLVVDRNTGAPIEGVMVEITDMTSGSKLFTGKTPATGDFKKILDNVKKGDIANYTIKLAHEGYLAKHVTFNYIFPDPTIVKLHQSLDLMLDKIEVGSDIGKLLKVNPIYFDLGKSVIRPDAAKELDKIVAAMIENPEIRIELDSHTDSRGSDAMNLALSDKRAKASAAYIVSKGISADRIKGKGYGETRLVNKCGNGVACSEADHQLNRRTEFIVVSMSK